MVIGLSGFGIKCCWGVSTISAAPNHARNPTSTAAKAHVCLTPRPFRFWSFDVGSWSPGFFPMPPETPVRFDGTELVRILARTHLGIKLAAVDPGKVAP
jgi:hypothetical protein